MNYSKKLRPLYLYDFLQSSTDENCGVTMSEIIDYLYSLNITAERKAIYDDIMLLTEYYNADIMNVRNGKRSEYRLMSRKFQLAELRLLVDAVQSSKFITAKKSDSLIKKLKTLAGPTDAETISGQVVVTGRIKSMEETIYYNVDKINLAISKNRQISFNYFEWTPEKQKRLKRDGKKYVVSPLSLCWDDENYYLIADENGTIKHFRVDKTNNIVICDQLRQNTNFDSGSYTNRVFGMFGGEECDVTLECDNSLAGAVIDRFGKNIIIVPHNNTFTFTVTVRISPQFFGWLCGFGDKIKILSPKSVKDEFLATVNSICNTYRSNNE